MKDSVIAILILIFFGCILPCSAAPGDIIWQKALGGAEEEWGYSLDSYQDGGIIVTGITYSQDGYVTGSHGNGDLWAVRLDQNGSLLWERAFGGNESDYGLSVKTLADGGSIIIGTTGSNSSDVTGYHGMGDAWILRLSPAGEKIWDRTYGGNLTDEGGDIIRTVDGGYMMVGYTMSTDGDVSGNHGGGDLWMIKIDSSGKILWQKSFGGSKRDSGSSIIQTSDGGFLMTGNSYSSDGDVTANHGNSDVWVVKTDTNGTISWQKTYGGSNLDWGHSAFELPGGDILVAGVTASSDGDVAQNHGAGDIWILRLTPSGQIIWEKTFGGSYSDNVWKMVPSSHGGAFVVGETFSTDGDVSGNHGDADLWVFEIDGNGMTLWNRTFGGSYYESGSWIQLLPDGNLAVTGTTRSFDGDVTGNHGGGDLWIAKIIGIANASIPLPSPTIVLGIPSYFTNNTSQDTTSTPITISPSPLPGLKIIPQDPDGDGRYEDLNGNGKIDLQDTTLFFSNFEWIKKNESENKFDFNGNGKLDYGDINALFAEVSS